MLPPPAKGGAGEGPLLGRKALQNVQDMQNTPGGHTGVIASTHTNMQQRAAAKSGPGHNLGLTCLCRDPTNLLVSRLSKHASRNALKPLAKMPTSRGNP